MAQGYRGVVLAPDETLALRTPIKTAPHCAYPHRGGGNRTGHRSGEQPVVRVERRGCRRPARRPPAGSYLRRPRHRGCSRPRSETAQHELARPEFRRHAGDGVPWNPSRSPPARARASAAQEQETAESLLQSGVNFDAIVALSAEATRGAYYALIEFNRAGTIRLIGFDQDMLPPIRNGGLDSVIAQDTYEIGRLAIEQIDASLRGDQVAEKEDCPTETAHSRKHRRA